MKIRNFAVFAFAAAATLAQAVVIMDQIGPNNTYQSANIYASQDFEPAFDAYDLATIDDFTTTSTGFVLRKVDAVIGFWAGATGPGGITAYRLSIYSSPVAAGNNLAGDIAHLVLGLHQVTATPWNLGNGFQHLVAIPGLSINLTPNTTYWVGLIPVMNLSGVGQVGIAETVGFAGTFPMNSNNVQANPGQGFGMGRFWTVGVNSAYRIDAVPEPSSLAALALGALALLRRRK